MKIINKTLLSTRCFFPICKSHYSQVSYAHNPGKTPLKYMTLGKLIEDTAFKYGDRTALISVCDDRRYSFADLYQESKRLAAGFHALGLKKGERLGLWTPNIIEFVTTTFAAAQAGLITVLLNPTAHEQDLEYYLNKVGIKALVCPDSYRNLRFYDILCNVLQGLEGREPDKLCFDNVPSLKSIITVSKSACRGTYNYAELIDNVKSDSIKYIENIRSHVQPDEIANIQYTSGTTGKPKAACLTHYQMVNNGYYVAKTMELDRDHHNICLQVPLFHVFGINVGIVTAQQFGTTLTLPSPLYSSSANLQALEQEKCTLVYGTPTMYIDLMNRQLEENRNIHLTTAFCGASPCWPELFEDIQNILKVKTLHIAYGLTEATAIAFLSVLSSGNELNFDTVGRVGEHMEAKVVDHDNNVVPLGTPGELCLRGYSVMVGYWDDEKQTQNVLDKDNWLKTGDQFVLTENGYGKIIGRIKDIIIRGGENICPKEIEDVLNAHSEILEAYVIGVTHNRLGEEVCACIRVKPNASISLKSIIEFCQKKLASFKIPSQMRILQAFPKTTSGKIQKYILKQQIESEYA